MEFYKACAALLGKDAESWNCKSTGASRHVRSCTLPKIGILNSDDLGNIDARIGPMRFDRVHPQQSWTIAICALLDCRDVDGITASLLFMVDVVVKLKPSELRRAGADFKVAIREKREAYPNIFVREVEEMVVSVAAKFKDEVTALLPLHVLQCVFEFVPLEENGVLCMVSKDFRQAAEDDSLWEDAYTERFLTRQGNGSAPHSAGLMSQADRKKSPQRRGGKSSRNGVKRRYLKRIMDPQVGDQIEVSWRGTFRMESQEVYNAMAWWPARVVRKRADPYSYEVHYAGWESRWDEWVPRERLRWGNERRCRALKGITPTEGDMVEMWCEGLHVPGAWLEAVVHSKAQGCLNLGEVLTSGNFWVDVHSVRLVRLGGNATDRDVVDQAEAAPFCSRLFRRTLKLFLGCFGLRVGARGTRRDGQTRLFIFSA